MKAISGVAKFHSDSAFYLVREDGTKVESSGEFGGHWLSLARHAGKFQLHAGSRPVVAQTQHGQTAGYLAVPGAIEEVKVSGAGFGQPSALQDHDSAFGYTTVYVVDDCETRFHRWEQRRSVAVRRAMDEHVAKGGTYGNYEHIWIDVPSQE